MRPAALALFLLLARCSGSSTDTESHAVPDAGTSDSGSDSGDGDGDGDGDSGADVTVEPGSLLNGQTGQAADYSCNGSFGVGAPEPSAVHPFHVASIRFKTAIGANLGMVDATGTPQGTTVTSDQSGNAALTLPSNSYASWEVSGVGCPDTCVPTYQFQSLTHSLAELNGGAIEQALGWDIDDFVGFISLAHVELTVGLAVVSVEDCARAPVENATAVVTVAGKTAVSCDLTAQPTLPCVAYLDATRHIDPTLTATGPSGVFVVITAPTTITASAFGIVAGTTQSAEIGTTALPLFEESVSLGTIYPR